MLWSFSGHHIFVQCQKKWFFMHKMANALAKHPKRREAYLLCQLKSLPAWRGSLVDKVIEEAVVPNLNRGMIPPTDQILRYANELADEQLRFATTQRFREEGMTKKKAGRQYAALFEVEYKGGIDAQALKKAREEIDKSLENLMSYTSLLETLMKAQWLGAQRSLSFSFDGTNVSVRAHPDLIAFFNNEQPIIIDWKVLAGQTSDYWLQLAVYALALSRSKPHVDWPASITAETLNPAEVRLVEVNLLNNQIKEHKVDNRDLVDLEDFISDSAWQMGLFESGKEFDESEVVEYESARNPRSCEYCQFQRLCW